MTKDERPQVARILASAEDILRDNGDHGLSMRKLAKAAGMSLGHLQHYFKTKDAVLISLIEKYFYDCSVALQEFADLRTSVDATELVAELVGFIFDHVGGELSDMCRIFREFWALATRNAEVSARIDRYYAGYAKQVSAMLEPVASSQVAVDRAVSFLIPWLEGYSITHFGMDHNPEETRSFLIATVSAILSDRIPVDDPV